MMLGTDVSGLSTTAATAAEISSSVLLLRRADGGASVPRPPGPEEPRENPGRKLPADGAWLRVTVRRRLAMVLLSH